MKRHIGNYGVLKKVNSVGLAINRWTRARLFNDRLVPFLFPNRPCLNVVRQICRPKCCLSRSLTWTMTKSWMTLSKLTKVKKLMITSDSTVRAALPRDESIWLQIRNTQTDGISTSIPTNVAK